MRIDSVDNSAFMSLAAKYPHGEARVHSPTKQGFIIGVHDNAEKDEIVKSVMHLKNAEIEEGYTKDAVISRQAGQNSMDLLVDVSDKRLFETEYAGNFKDKQQLNLLLEFLGLGCLVLCAFFRSPVLSNVEDKLRKLLIGLGVLIKYLESRVCAYKDGEVIVDTAAGVLGRYDPRPVQPASLFPVFSVSKGITTGLFSLL
ncbi:hypothetical protein OROMI_013422 [Orobanche minor]